MMMILALGSKVAAREGANECVKYVALFSNNSWLALGL